MVLGATALLVVGLVIPADLVGIERVETALPILTYLGVGCAVLALLALAVVPGLMTASGRASIAGGKARLAATGQLLGPESAKALGPQASRLCGLFAKVTIVRAAIAEGVAILAGVAFMVEGEATSLIVAIVLILALVLQLPTRARMAAWLEEQLRLIEQGRPQDA